jgi:hypothetical protein
MHAHDVRVGARVRLSEDGRARRLWGPQSDAEARIREARLIDNGRGGMCVRVTVDGERRARIRTMQLDYLDIVR